MKEILIFLLLFLNLYLISSLNKSIIFTNPYLSNKTYNPINSKIIILSKIIIISELQLIQSISPNRVLNGKINLDGGANPIGSVSVIEDRNTSVSLFIQNRFMILKHYDKYYYNSYALSPDFFAFIDDSNTKYFIIENKLYKINGDNWGKYSFEFKQNLNFSYIDIIKGNPIIIYGTKYRKLCFYYIESDTLIYSDLEIINDTNISCKLLLNNSFVCIYSQNEQVRLSILYKANDQNVIANITYSDFNNINFFSEISELIIYDTDKTDYKIICGRRKDNIGNINCILANFIFQLSTTNNGAGFGTYGGDLFDGDKSNSYCGDANLPCINKEIKFYSINEINTTFSFNESNCNYTMFKSEYLICCGNIDVIICERRDKNFTLINSFNLTLNGNIKNLVLENHNDTHVELLYYNETLDKIYGYLIYPPKCNDINLALINNGSSFINLNDLFERNTNTNYYISFDTISSDNINIKINNNDINNLWEKINLESSDNKLYYDFYNIQERKNIIINYNISIEETYSDLCTISISFKSCYDSCEKCSLSKEDSNITSHNCIKCKEEYYPFPDSSNCFSEKEIHDINFSYYFFNRQNKTFQECSPECLTCKGPNENDCLSCKNESILVNNGKCLVHQNEVLIYNDNVIESSKLDEESSNSRIETENDVPTDKIISYISKIENTSHENGNEPCNENLFLALNGEYVSICPNDTYGFSLNKTCLPSCPNDYEKDQKQKKCVKKIEHTTSTEFKEQIYKNITDFINTLNS